MGNSTMRQALKTWRAVSLIGGNIIHMLPFYSDDVMSVITNYRIHQCQCVSLSCRMYPTSFSIFCRGKIQPRWTGHRLKRQIAWLLSVCIVHKRPRLIRFINHWDRGVCWFEGEILFSSFFSCIWRCDKDKNNTKQQLVTAQKRPLKGLF